MGEGVWLCVLGEREIEREKEGRERGREGREREGEGEGEGEYEREYGYLRQILCHKLFLCTLEMSYSGGMPGGSGMRPTSPRSTFGQQNPTGGYPGAQQGGPSGQYGKGIVRFEFCWISN